MSRPAVQLSFGTLVDERAELADAATAFQRRPVVAPLPSYRCGRCRVEVAYKSGELLRELRRHDTVCPGRTR